GHGANYWINRFTIIEIQRLLRNRTVSLVQMADDFNFSSQAYFSRFVQNYLGTSPSAYRD
ncbi:MAG: helix-turn-helix domain-containing protein, partial [Bacteroidaceae bacterium]|nr:helix-turn-helix domain-containing protein [Bacteroidaceae bacterium]